MVTAPQVFMRKWRECKKRRERERERGRRRKPNQMNIVIHKLCVCHYPQIFDDKIIVSKYAVNLIKHCQITFLEHVAIEIERLSFPRSTKAQSLAF